MLMVRKSVKLNADLQSISKRLVAVPKSHSNQSRMEAIYANELTSEVSIVAPATVAGSQFLLNQNLLGCLYRLMKSMPKGVG